MRENVIQKFKAIQYSSKEMKNLKIFWRFIYYIIYLKDIGKHWNVKASQKDSVPVCAISYETGTWRVLPGKETSLSSSPHPVIFGGREQPGNSRATHRARFSTSRRIGTFPTGYTELTRRPRIPGEQEEDERRSTVIRGRGRWLYVKWIRQRYASSRWIAFPALLTILFPGSGALTRTVVVVFSEQVSIRGSLQAKAQVALIASSKSKLIDEFRRRVARK